jgi:hypothetical protein
MVQWQLPSLCLYSLHGFKDDQLLSLAGETGTTVQILNNV